MSKKIKMKAIAMKRPSKDFIYVPSELRPSVEIDEKEFIEKYAGGWFIKD